LTHTEKTEEVAELAVRFPEEFAEYPEQAIEQEKEGKDITISFFSILVDPKDKE